MKENKKKGNPNWGGLRKEYIVIEPGLTSLKKNQVRLSDIFNIIRVYIKRKVSNERKI